MNLAQVKKVYFIGIGGSGISGLAKIFKLQGKDVSGSDLNPSEFTEDLQTEGVKIFIGQKAENIPNDADLYVYSDAVPLDNI